MYACIFALLGQGAVWGEGLQTEQSYSSVWIFDEDTNSMLVCRVLRLAEIPGIWVSQHLKVPGRAEQPAALLLSSKKYQCFHQQDWHAGKHCFQNTQIRSGCNGYGHACCASLCFCARCSYEFNRGVYKPCHHEEICQAQHYMS